MSDHTYSPEDRQRLLHAAYRQHLAGDLDAAGLDEARRRWGTDYAAAIKILAGVESPFHFQGPGTPPPPAAPVGPDAELAALRQELAATKRTLALLSDTRTLQGLVLRQLAGLSSEQVTTLVGGVLLGGGFLLFLVVLGLFGAPTSGIR